MTTPPFGTPPERRESQQLSELTPSERLAQGRIFTSTYPCGTKRSPGSIATVIGIATEIAELKTLTERALAYSATVTSIVVTCFVIWLTLHSALYVSRIIGQGGLNAATRMIVHSGHMGDVLYRRHG